MTSPNCFLSMHKLTPNIGLTILLLVELFNTSGQSKSFLHCIPVVAQALQEITLLIILPEPKCCSAVNRPPKD